MLRDEILAAQERGELVPTDTPGYWRFTAPCKGAPECRQPLHGTMFNEGPVYHTVLFQDRPRDSWGRWASPYRTWMQAQRGGDDGR